MKRITLFSVAILSACTIGVTTPLKANAEVYYSTSVSRPSEGDTWFRNVGDGTDTLNYENGKWVLAMSDSIRRKNAYHQYVVDVYEPNAQAISEAQAKQNAYIDSAIENPNLYQSLPDSKAMSVYVMRVTNGQPFKGTVRIPKVTIPDQVPIKSANTFVSANVPVMLSVVGTSSSSESNSDSTSSANSSSSAESNNSSSSAQSTSSSAESNNSSSSAQSTSSSAESSGSSSSAQESVESNITNSSIKDSESNAASQIQSNGNATATTNAAKTTTKNVASATTKSVAMNTSNNSSDTTKNVSTKSPVVNSTTSSNQSKNQTSSSASSMSKIKKNMNNMLPQTDEAKSNVVTFGLLTLFVSMIGFISIFRYKDGSKI
ncbi:hypothetical protein [Lactiplantibacillus pentosus]|uniref:hypothetical protein n=1 Tax=Lactiplantibacillus pentosus TaxID=1589 RepID=UPI001C1E0160|nr:hypothetical protein [Lactiplantibacillus pentosus]MCC3162234.1 hypothetical protein [Lactiplantibacillus pentosus]MCJ8187394.1 hypothetical protein [Lactiplantibacillus pentosus]